MPHRICLLLILFIGCTTRKDALFDLMPSRETGLNFTNKIVSTDEFNIIEYLYFYNGGGVSIGDINNDGLQDVFLTANQGKNSLFLNLGGFKFKEISQSAGIDGIGDWSTGVTMCDVNGDGLLDIHVCNVSGYKGRNGSNELFINNGDLTFTEAAASYGLAFSGFSTQASFFDYDRDGDLDMYLLNHSVHSIHSYGSSDKRHERDSTAGDRLFESQVAQGNNTFVDVTVNSGIYSSHIGYGLGITTSDINNDGWPDLYISNDFHENDYLYINQQDGTFKEQLTEMMLHTSRYSMGNDVADINNDGMLDVITLDMLPNDPGILMKSAGEDHQKVYDIKLQYGYDHQYSRNALQVNMGNNRFSDIALQTNTYDTDWSWAPLICDLNNDGLNDIFIANGIYKRPNDLDYINYVTTINQNRSNTQKINEDSIEAEMIARMPTLKISNFLFKNVGGHQFVDSTSSWGLNMPSYSNGAAYGDLDNDGDLDLVINNVNQETFLYKNKSNELLNVNYLQISLKFSDYNRYGIGSMVTAYFNNTLVRKEHYPTRGFQSSVEQIITFGTGDTDVIDSLQIRWPDGTLQMTYNLKANQRVTIKHNPDEATRSSDASTPVNKIIESKDYALNYEHQENQDFKDYNRELLIPYKLSNEGPALSIGDVNNDQLEDVFFGGAKGQPGAVFIQNIKGQFEKSDQPNLARDLIYEDVDATFFDANGDGSVDLYVVSGGNEFESQHPYLMDRLYINDKRGRFVRSIANSTLPRTNGACVQPEDFDKDGDVDLFVGSRSIPGRYGVAPPSFLLINDGTGKFIQYQDSTLNLELGMVTDAVWLDYDSDQDMDLAIVGDWMPVTILENNDGKFVKSDIRNTNGWWRSIEAGDIDNDGDIDLIAGNTGLNSKLKASINEPVTMYLADFDDNGQLDPLIFHYKNEKQIPFATKDELSKQLPLINKRFNTYEKYSRVNGIESMFNNSELQDMDTMQVYTFNSTVFINQNNGTFQDNHLSESAQMSSINDMLLFDVNNNGLNDLITVGNFYGNVVNLGRFDALPGAMLMGNGSGFFEFDKPIFMQSEEQGEYRKIDLIKFNGNAHIIAVRNDDEINIKQIQLFE